MRRATRRILRSARDVRVVSPRLLARARQINPRADIYGDPVCARRLAVPAATGDRRTGGRPARLHALVSVALGGRATDHAHLAARQATGPERPPARRRLERAPLPAAPGGARRHARGEPRAPGGILRQGRDHGLCAGARHGHEGEGAGVDGLRRAGRHHRGGCRGARLPGRNSLRDPRGRRGAGRSDRGQLGDDTGRRAMRDAARALVEERYSREPFLTGMLALYDRVRQR